METKAQKKWKEGAIGHLLYLRAQREFLALFHVKCPYCGAMYAISKLTSRKGFDVCPECWNIPERRVHNMKKQLDFNFPDIENINYKKKYYKCLIAMNEFNSLPWWRRMFYRFDISAFRGTLPDNVD